jgi:palmitoyl-protein thioesterase
MLSEGLAFRPVVIMHGMGNNERGYQKNIDAIRAAYPGIYVKALAVYDDKSSYLTHMDKQLAGVVAAIQADDKLSQGFNFYGESQGALLARTYVSTHNEPAVHNLVALCGPQNGVGECPSVEVPGIKQACGDLGSDLDIYKWPFCSFCSYWRGVDEAKYLDKSQWLAAVNNDRFNQTGGMNETFRRNMVSLNKYMVTYAERDEVVQPPKSAWHTYWRWGDYGRSAVMNLSETETYKHDVLGLKTLDERGDLIMNSFNGSHVSYQMEWWETNVLPMFNNSIS